jgi:ABC-type glycerol-3-phosphate transport system substrate-binding protein
MTSRRNLLKYGFFAGTAAVLAACGGAPLPTPAVPTVPPAKPTEAPKPAAAATTAPAAGATTAPAGAATKPAAAATTAPAAGAAATKPAAAAGAAAAPTTAPVPTAVKPVTLGPGQILLRMHSRTGSEGTKPEAGIKVVEEKNPKIKIQLETFPTAEFTTKVLTMAAGGQLGDLIWGSPSNYHVQVGNNLWFDVTPLVQSTNYDLKPFFKSALDYLTAHDGKLWSLPYKAHPGSPAIYYNVEHLQKQNVANPPSWKTYDELSEVAVKLHRGGAGSVEMYGILPNTGWNHSVPCILRAFGSDETDSVFKATKSTLDTPQALQAFQWYHDLYHKHKIAPIPGPGVDTGDAVFAAAKGALLQASSSTKQLEGTIGGKFTMRNLLMPPGPSGKVGTKLVFDNFGMYNKTKYPQESFDVLAYFCGKEHGIRLGLPEGGGSWTCGARNDVFYSDELMKSTPNHKIFAEVTEKADPSFYPENFRLNEYATALTQGYQKIMLNETPPTAATMKELQQSLQAVLDRPKP